MLMVGESLLFLIKVQMYVSLSSSEQCIPFNDISKFSTFVLRLRYVNLVVFSLIQKDTLRPHPPNPTPLCTEVLLIFKL